MYAYIKGIVAEVGIDHIVLDNNGIGYMIYIPFNANVSVPSEGEEVLIYTHYNATEAGVTLFGFLSKEDREMYKSMTTVSGIGPKGAISILSTLTSRDIMMAVLNEDDKAISKAPGIGPKTARRMILDLKDKMNITEEDLLGEVSLPQRSVDSGSIQDAVMALSALGYNYAEAQRAVKGIENAENLDVEELLSLALKEL